LATLTPVLTRYPTSHFTSLSTPHAVLFFLLLICLFLFLIFTFFVLFVFYLFSFICIFSSLTLFHTCFSPIILSSLHS
jgi:hypothetical protein